MDAFLDIFSQLSLWCKKYSYETALAIMATLIVLFGNKVNLAIKRHINRFNFIIRTAVFILVCAVGYGAALIFLTPWLADILVSLHNLVLSPILLFLFIGIGMIADRNY
ncbi:DUF3392 family protein [Spartinivicinus poritis]|uniref:DUF3392 family protein n=1 Tax=Spartinivicinus poritis TaxID=2994640 RepID=A0ABT5UA89_9GAMM|nr:DUF3392 family protein [Spartinivicinus sp. A2-2]MDE1463298.1 DUF3392 family protein [Spartinivicinus sp. A2-2]